MPKTLKPKKMPKSLEARLARLVAGEDGPWGMTEIDARNILAAMEYERQRADGKRTSETPSRCACGHLLRNHFKAGEFACKVANCGCPRYVGV